MSRQMILLVSLAVLLLCQDASAQGCPSPQWCQSEISSCLSNPLVTSNCACLCRTVSAQFRLFSGSSSSNLQGSSRRRDVLFLIDESRSVGIVNFRKFIRLTQALIRNFCGKVDIGLSGTRVSVVSFDSHMHSHMDFDDHFTKASLMSAVGQITYNQRGSKDTCLVDALEYAKDDAFTLVNGARVNDPNVERVIVLLSDGCGNCRKEQLMPRFLRLVAADLRKQGVALITFFVGAHEQVCANQISSLNEGSRCTQLYLFEDWVRLDTATQVFQTSNCRNTWTVSSPCLSGFGSWNNWNALERCSVTCGGGTQRRSRSCSQLNRCIGNADEIHACNTADCPVPPTCSRSCGGGLRRVQNCFQGSCATSFQNCNTYPCLSGRKEVEFVVTMFLRAITSGSFSFPTGQCAEDYIGSNKNIRMIGARCQRKTRARRQATTTSLQNGFPKSKRDVLFLVDESVSVGREHFGKFKRLVKSIISKAFCGPIDIGERKTRVGVLTFDSHQHPHVNFRKSHEKGKLMREIDGVSYNHTTGGFTCLQDGLKFAKDQLFTFSGGARMNDQDTEQVLVLLSDGCTYCKHSASKSSSLLRVAAEFRQKGIPVISFVVGKQSDECIQELKALVNGFRCLELFVLDNWNQVDIAINQFETSACQTSWGFQQC